MVRNEGRATRQPSSVVQDLDPAAVEAHLLAHDATLLDVRAVEEPAEQGWIAGAIHVPAGDLGLLADPSSDGCLPSLEPHRLTIVHDAVGDRSPEATETLIQLGYRQVAQLVGGISAWEVAGYPVAGRALWHPSAVALTARRPMNTRRNER